MAWHQIYDDPLPEPMISIKWLIFASLYITDIITINKLQRNNLQNA